VTGLVAAAAGLLAGSLPAGATAVSPSTSVCTYTVGTQSSTSALTGMSGGTAVSITCTGLGAGETVSIAEASPLAAVVSPAADRPDELDTAAVQSATATSTGSLSATFTLPATFTATDPNATCPPSQAQVDAGLVACTLQLADATSGTVLNQAALLYSGQPTPAPPTLKLSPTSAAPYDTVTVSDASAPSGYWWGNATQATSIPAADIVVGTSAALSSSVSVSAATYVVTSTSPWASTLTPPALSGTFVVPAGAVADGATTVAIYEPDSAPLPGNSTNATFAGDVTASASFSVVDTAATTVLINPGAGGTGSVIGVAGSGFDPQGSPVTIEFAQNATAPFTEIGTDRVTVTVQPNGTFLTAITIGSSETSGLSGNITAYVAASQTAVSGAVPATLSASAPLTLEPVTAICTVSGTGSCPVDQELAAQVLGSVLSAVDTQTGSNPAPVNVAMSSVTLNGQYATSTGVLNTVQVTDARGTLSGWTVTAQLESDFSNAAPSGNSTDNTIPAGNLSWVPSVTAVTGTAGQASAGPSATFTVPPAPAVTLCAAPAGGGGGTFDCNASLSLAVPPYVAAGTYQAVMDIVLTGT